MKWDRLTLAAALPVAAVAVIAGVVSFGHIEALALAEHQTITAARLYPFSVDFLIIAGSVVALAGYWPGWLAVAVGVAGTVYANLESGLPYGAIAGIVATWPAVSFTVASLVLERWVKRQAGRGGTGGSDRLGEIRESGNFLTEPEPPLATPEPEVAMCGHKGTGTPEQNVVDDYLHTRDCLGETPSQRKLAAAWGLSRPKVAQLVGSLNGHAQPEVPDA